MATVISVVVLIAYAELAWFPSIASMAVVPIIAGSFPAPRRVATSSCYIILGLAGRLSSLMMSASSVNINVSFSARQGSCLYNFPFIRTGNWRCHCTDRLALSLTVCPVFHQDLFPQHSWQPICALLWRRSKQVSAVNCQRNKPNVEG